MVNVYFTRHCKIFLDKINWSLLFIMKIKWVIVEVFRKYHFSNKPSPNSLLKSTCLELNGIQQNANNFHANNIDISNDVSKPLLKTPSYVQVRDIQQIL